MGNAISNDLEFFERFGDWYFLKKKEIWEMYLRVVEETKQNIPFGWFKVIVWTTYWKVVSNYHKLNWDTAALLTLTKTAVRESKTLVGAPMAHKYQKSVIVREISLYLLAIVAGSALYRTGKEIDELNNKDAKKLVPFITPRGNKVYLYPDNPKYDALYQWTRDWIHPTRNQAIVDKADGITTERKITTHSQ